MEKDLLRSMPIEKWYNILIKKFKTRTPRALRNFMEQIDAQADIWIELARRPTTSWQYNIPRTLPQGKQPLLLENGEGSPSRPTQKPSTNQRMPEDEEDD